ncbi:hypothetical protein CEY12_16820 [Chryseobacterium sp. T16E-39]|uniref:hypothetical protein n=1 Tax=Chryseobacterium sp. T16E-39 TaxID=2015076 RepID=UPI000B5B3302|nr:hypothetical protein [Chryseobacterium sp. T16E-39]ASK31674.1 hypothetical protein CEY12_16820 [Chryseobacterium sp. T16E-39]
MIQDFIYYALLVICLAVSFYNEKARHNYFWLYFLVVLLYEVLIYFKWIGVEIYATSPIVYSLFFINVYLKELYPKKHFIRYLSSAILLIVGILLYPTNKGYSIHLGIMMSFVYILCGLIWLFYQFKNNSQIPIISKQFFWVSVSLLLWAVFFLFRVTPMYLFEKTDDEFLGVLNKIFQLITIASYVIFFKGLLCKS